jgi:hypothetical protein
VIVTDGTSGCLEKTSGSVTFHGSSSRTLHVRDLRTLGRQLDLDGQGLGGVEEASGAEDWEEALTYSVGLLQVGVAAEDELVDA